MGIWLLFFISAQMLADFCREMCIRDRSKTDYMQLEVWRYDPVCFSHAGTVDIVSLAASFRSHPDERIEMAVDEMLEDYQW